MKFSGSFRVSVGIAGIGSAWCSSTQPTALRRVGGRHFTPEMMSTAP